MKTRTRNIMIAAGFVLMLFVGLMGYAAFSLYSFMSPFMTATEIPPQIKEPGVHLGQEKFTRTEMFRLDQAGFLKLLADGTKIRDENEREKMMRSETAKGIYNFSDVKVFRDEIIAVGQFGGYIFDLSGNLKRQVVFDLTVEKIKIGPIEQDSYESPLDNIRIVRLETNKFGFLSFGFSQGVRVFDENGHQIWATGMEPTDLSVLFKDDKEREAHYEKKRSVLEAAVGDLDNDGISEYIVARKTDGIRAYDRTGREKWFQPADFPSHALVVFDLDGDGKNELLELGENVRDSNGNILGPLKGNDSTIFGVDSKTQKPKLEFLQFGDNKLTTIGVSGDTVFRGEAPLSEIKVEPKKFEISGHPENSFTDDNESVYSPKGVWITFRKGGPAYLAVVAPFTLMPRAHVYIYESNGKLIYHELLGENAETIAVLPSADGNENLLVGGKDTIWKYSLN